MFSPFKKRSNIYGLLIISSPIYHAKIQHFDLRAKQVKHEKFCWVFGSVFLEVYRGVEVQHTLQINY